MLTKLKLALALSSTLVAGVGGIAMAQGWDGGGKAAMLQKYDTNGDGKLDDQEKAAMRADFKAKHAAKKAAMLAKYDTNKDGKLEPAERQVMIQDRAATQFKKMDTDGNGTVTLAEFQAFKVAHPGHRHARFGGRGFRHGLDTGSAGAAKAKP